MEASATHLESGTPHLEPEPLRWQTKSLWVSTRLWCGAVSFFFLSFLFAYFYLRSLDTNHSWKIGAVNPSGGLGVAVMGLILLSAVLLRIGYARPDDTLATGAVAMALTVIAIGLQFVEYTTLGFGPASGGYASVFVGWTATYILAAVCGLYWIETQMATLWRAKREGTLDENGELLRAGIEACSFFWAYFAAVGVLTYIVLYLL